MHEAIRQMLEKYDCRRLEDYVQALREILQEIALLGLWRSKFFERAAFYGGTSLRILHGLDRFSEDMDFSLLSSKKKFNLGRYGDALQREMRAYGFDVWTETKSKRTTSAIQSAFLKANTLKQLLIIEAGEEIVRELPRGQQVKIKVEVDTDPPGGFETEIAYLLQPIPFSVRVYTLPDLFAGKMHALLCRKWKQRVKGRDWYDLIWYVTHHPTLHLSHLEQRLRQSGDRDVITPQVFRKDLHDAIDALDVDQAKRDIEPFVKNPETLDVWSHTFFHTLVNRIQLI
ncbi:MAG: nucleotidyl transferase AbiEii/AbiGii toxin family protein [Candidatus Latescibacteria bacterium]|nr:nucleotidyl transferase AbiEii/AbiGii toxin family protein [Candidatus Latescibacterota bacterium]